MTSGPYDPGPGDGGAGSGTAAGTGATGPDRQLSGAAAGPAGSLAGPGTPSPEGEEPSPGPGSPPPEGDDRLAQLITEATGAPPSAPPAPGELAAHQPVVALRHAALLAADTIGVMLAGGRRPEAVALARGDPHDELTGSWRHPQPRPGAGARLLTAGHGFAEPDRAAYVNATAACALELDEGTRPTGHPAIHVLPAALAAGEALGSRWSELLSAFTAGYEVAAGLFEQYALRPPAHPHGHLGSAGAAVAVALLAGDDPLAAARAATTLPLLTTWPPCLEGATVRNTWPGHAAATGLLARRLVSSGHSGSATALAAAFDGLVADRLPAPLRASRADATAERAAPAEAPAHGVPSGPAAAGDRVLAGYLKLYSACALTHSAIQAALQLAPPGPVGAKSPQRSAWEGTAASDGSVSLAVSSVDVEVNANSLKVAAQPADSALSRRFSLPYAVAVALLHGDAGPPRFDTADPEGLALARRVTVSERPEFTGQWPDRAPARVTVRLADGRTRTAQVDDADGHPGAPVGVSAVEAKFRSLTGLSSAVFELLCRGGGDLRVGEVLDAVTGQAPAAG